MNLSNIDGLISRVNLIPSSNHTKNTNNNDSTLCNDKDYSKSTSSLTKTKTDDNTNNINQTKTNDSTNNPLITNQFIQSLPNDTLNSQSFSNIDTKSMLVHSESALRSQVDQTSVSSNTLNSNTASYSQQISSCISLSNTSHSSSTNHEDNNAHIIKL